MSMSAESHLYTSKGMTDAMNITINSLPAPAVANSGYEHMHN